MINKRYVPSMEGFQFINNIVKLAKTFFGNKNDFFKFRRDKHKVGYKGIKY